MTTPTHHRDPRLRRHHGAPFAPPVDALAAAVRLDLAADAMRAGQLERGPDDDVPLTAQAFADALEHEVDEHERVTIAADPLPADCGVQLSPVAQPAVALSAAPTSAAPLVVTPPSTPTSAPVVVPAVFSSEHRPLTWRSRHDERSLAFGVRSRLAGRAPLVDHSWATGPVIDQGTEGACVGCGVVDATNVLRLEPGVGGTVLTLDDALRLYHRAQQLDEVPGVNYSGTSVLAGMQAGVEAGYFSGFVWAFGTRDIADALLQVGPVVLGLPWLPSMHETGPGGLVVVEGPSDDEGHCLVATGLRLKGPQGQPGPYFELLNSWGPSWGEGGRGYIHHRDLANLLHGVGEAAIPQLKARR